MTVIDTNERIGMEKKWKTRTKKRGWLEYREMNGVGYGRLNSANRPNLEDITIVVRQDSKALGVEG